MAWTRKDYKAMDDAYRAHEDARRAERQARQDGKSAAEIRRLANASTAAARVFNRAASSKKR